MITVYVSKWKKFGMNLGSVKLNKNSVLPIQWELLTPTLKLVKTVIIGFFFIYLL